MIGCSLKLSPFRAWVLFDLSGLYLLREWKKERKNTEQEKGSERKRRKERKKKCSETEREETFTTEDQDFPPLVQCSSWKEDKISKTSSTLAKTSSRKALALENSNSTLFYYPKKPLYHYTISFYNISSIPNFYFPILLIKIIYLHDIIMYPQTQIKTKTQITTCYHHHDEQLNPPLCSFPFSFHAPDKPYASKIVWK